MGKQAYLDAASEQIALQWSDLNMESRALTITEQRTGECGKLIEKK